MDRISVAARSENMKALRSKGMKPELAVRRMVHSMGYRYRLHVENLPGKPDLVFRARKKLIFVHGCFWHQHQDDLCRLTHTPKSNLDYWLSKLRANVERDAKNRRCLEGAGWKILVIWECEVSDSGKLERSVRAFLDG